MKITITYLMGKSDLNGLIRKLDLGMDGVFVEEQATLTLKDGTKINKHWKTRFIKAYTQVHKQHGFEVNNFKFSQEL